LSCHANIKLFHDDSPEVIRWIDSRMGYRINLTEATWPPVAAAGSTMTFSTKWRNAGVAPCLPTGNYAVTVKDAQGHIALIAVDDSMQMQNLAVFSQQDAPVVSKDLTIAVPSNLPAGSYSVFVSVGTTGDLTGKPVIALPLPGDDGCRRYRLGEV